MHILVVTNLYPPYYIGGYELACADVVEALKKRGHRVAVLTSSWGFPQPREESGILRFLRVSLRHAPPFRFRVMELSWYLKNLLVLRAIVAQVKPDVIHVFSPTGLGGLILDWLHSQPVPIVHDISDIGLVYACEYDSWFEKCHKRPNLTRSYFRSRFLKARLAEFNFDVEGAPVIYHGVRPDDLRLNRGEANHAASIMFSGRLTPEKGVHVFLQALSLLKASPHMSGARITIIGPICESDYWQELQHLAKELEPYLLVHFAGHLPRDDAISLLREHSIFVFPVIWDEPFAITLLEAMGAGLAVIATRTGGSAEILADGENCVVVPTDDPRGLANGIERLIADESLCHRLSIGGRETIKHFDFDRSIDLIEEHLLKVIAQKVR